MIATLYALAMAVLMVYGLNLYWLAVGYARQDRLLPGPVPEPDAREPWYGPLPTVTVQLPLYNEQYVAERVIDACARLDYPRERLEIQVLDDSTDATKDLVERRVAFWRARGIDIVHVHRSDRTGYKAGALQNGLRMARGELVAIFDADFVPRPDYLWQMLPHLQDERVGMVQARWGHLNADDSLLTRIQAASLDAHFAVEQYVRSRLGYFMNFNGTAGIWRAACIEDAGGWEGDTLTEDLDLSYRAQLKGWRFRFVPEVEVLAELPADINALRAQQFRWTKGAAETSRKILGRLWRSDQPLRVKIEGTLHLTNHIVFPFVLLVAALHAPLVLLRGLGIGPGNLYFGLMGLGLFAFVGVLLVQVFAQRALYPDWIRRLRVFPWFMAGSMGLALNNSRAVWQALRGKRSAFVRTPKFSTARNDTARARWKNRYAHRGVPTIVWLEGALTLYCVAGLGVAVAVGEWAAVSFQALFTLGFGMMSFFSIYQHVQTRRSEQPQTSRMRALPRTQPGP